MIKNFEEELYRKVLEVKDNLYYQKPLNNDLITKVVLSVSGVYHKRDGASGGYGTPVKISVCTSSMKLTKLIKMLKSGLYTMM